MAASDPCKPPVGVSQSSTSTECYRSVPESDFWTAVKGAPAVGQQFPGLLCWAGAGVGRRLGRRQTGHECDYIARGSMAPHASRKVLMW